MKQELDFEEKVAKLHSDFPQVDVTEITGYLSASDGSYDTAYALVLQSVEDFKEQVGLLLLSHKELYQLTSSRACCHWTLWQGLPSFCRLSSTPAISSYARDMCLALPAVFAFPVAFELCATLVCDIQS